MSHYSVTREYAIGERGGRLWCVWDDVERVIVTTERTRKAAMAEIALYEKHGTHPAERRYTVVGSRA